jgi:hypothetical protein
MDEEVLLVLRLTMVVVIIAVKVNADLVFVYFVLYVFWQHLMPVVVRT